MVLGDSSNISATKGGTQPIYIYIIYISATELEGGAHHTFLSS